MKRLQRKKIRENICATLEPIRKKPDMNTLIILCLGYLMISNFSVPQKRLVGDWVLDLYFSPFSTVFSGSVKRHEIVRIFYQKKNKDKLSVRVWSHELIPQFDVFLPRLYENQA